MDCGSSQHSAGLELHRAEIAQFRLPARVVEALDVVAPIGSTFVAGAVDLAGGSLGHLRGKEAFHRRIVPDVSGPAHRADGAVLGQKPFNPLLGVL